AFDLTVQPSTSADVDHQAAVVIGARVLPDGLRVVALQQRFAKEFRPQASHVLPELLSARDVGALMDVDAADEPVRRRSGHGQEPQERVYQPRVAVHEGHPVAVGIGLTLRSLAPVGNSSGNENLSVAQGADLGCGAVAYVLPLSLATGVLRCPVPGHALGI